MDPKTFHANSKLYLNFKNLTHLSGNILARNEPLRLSRDHHKQKFPKLWDNSSKPRKFVFSLPVSLTSYVLLEKTKKDSLKDIEIANANLSWFIQTKF